MYEKFANWKNFPDESTPITAAALTHIEQGITDADITRDGTPAEVALSSRLSATAGSAEGLVQAERAAREAALALKADSAEMIDALGLKANASAVYTKAQSDTALGLKANSADVYTKNAVYTKGEVESGLSQKPNKTDVYTKAETFSRAETGTQITNAITASRPPLYGTGFPNGVVAAPVGTLYADAAVTNGASLWQKVSGTGNTGWKVVSGDTGVRNIAALLGPKFTIDTPGGGAFIERRGDQVAASIAVKGLGSAGFEGLLPRMDGFTKSRGGIAGVGRMGGAFFDVGVYGGDMYFQVMQPVTSGTVLVVQLQYFTNDPWPSTLPGTN